LIEPTTTPVTAIPWRQWRLIATVFVSALLFAVIGGIYTHLAIAQEDRTVRAAIVTQTQKLCGIFVLLDGTYRKTPPSTKAGIAFAAQIHQIVVDLDCGAD
jgi:hypothetical protein